MAAWFRPIRLAVIRRGAGIRVFFGQAYWVRIGMERMRIRLSSKYPLRLLEKMPAIELDKRRIYAKTNIRLRRTENWAKASVDGILARQGEFMRELIEQQKEAIRKDVRDAYEKQKKSKTR